ncbi:probable RNA-dependent RNA polymerase 1 [Tanacetum coccineum]
MVKTVDVYGFPELEPADKIKTVLEGYTGNGSIEALKVKLKSGGEERVQGSYLKVWERDMDLVQKPRHYALETNGVTLHFGCQVSKQVLSVLYTMRNASVKFGFGARKLYFGVTEPHASYKLQLSYENIWQVQFHRACGLTLSFLVIQKVENNVFSFYREEPNDQWVRATDFTSSASIGQSSHPCLELSRDVDLNLGDYFPYYEESGRPFNLKTGHSFSQSTHGLNASHLFTNNSIELILNFAKSSSEIMNFALGYLRFYVEVLKIIYRCFKSVDFNI